jgi:GxxExxY protein
MKWEDVEPSLNELSGRVIDAAIVVHKALGPGLLERVYHTCLAHELRRRRLRVEEEVAVRIDYEGIALESGFRMDLLVEQVLVVEVKAVEALCPIHTAQVMTYLKLAQREVGLLLNFNAFPLAIRRVVSTRG